VSTHETPPPLEFRGPIAESIRNRITDHKQCHSCCETIERGDTWGAIGDCPLEGSPRLVFVRLCGKCWDLATVGMTKLRKGWAE